MIAAVAVPGVPEQGHDLIRCHHVIICWLLRSKHPNDRGDTRMTAWYDDGHVVGCGDLDLWPVTTAGDAVF